MDFPDAEDIIQEVQKYYKETLNLSEEMSLAMAQGCYLLLKTAENIIDVAEKETIKDTIKVKQVLVSCLISWLYGIEGKKDMERLANLVKTLLEYISEKIPHTEIMKMPTLFTDDEDKEEKE